MEKQLSISQLSRLTGRTRKTLLDWANKGKISSITNGNKKLFPLAEVLRVFPDLHAEEIEKELAFKVDTLSNPTDTLPPYEAPNTQSVRIAELESLVERLQLQVELLTRQIEILDRERNTLERQLNIQNEQTTQLLTRLLPAQSSARRAATQPRNANGQFAPKGSSGDGVKALLGD